MDTPHYIWLDKNGKEIKREPKGRGRPRSDAVKSAADGHWYIKEGDSPVKAESEPVEKRIVFYIFRDEKGTEIARIPRGRGRPRTDGIVGEDGNIYLPLGVRPVTVTGEDEGSLPVMTAAMAAPVAKSQYIFRDTDGKEIGRQDKGRGRTRHDATLGEDGNWYVTPGVRPDDDTGVQRDAATLAIIESSKPNVIEDVPAGFSVVLAPSGVCPVKLAGTDEASVYNWRESLRKIARSNNQILSTQAMEYYLNNIRKDRQWIEDRNIAIDTLRKINAGYTPDEVKQAA